MYIDSDITIFALIFRKFIDTICNSVLKRPQPHGGSLNFKGNFLICFSNGRRRIAQHKFYLTLVSDVHGTRTGTSNKKEKHIQDITPRGV